VEYRIDLHIHSVLSPCADLLMTADNIINKLMENDIKIFSITDHNSSKNSRVIQEKAKKNKLLFVPGVEIQTMEEIHILAYFMDIDTLESFTKEIYKILPAYKNREEIYGYQLILDKDDEYIQKEDMFLAGSISLGIDELYSLIKSYKGYMVPAHIDRSNSIVSNLGYIPDIDFDAIEIYDPRKINSLIKNYNINKPIISNSDAHSLNMIGEKKMYIDLEKFDCENVFKSIKKNKIRIV